MRLRELEFDDMSLPWFRLYRELKDDPKIGALDDSTFRVFIESLCWACEKGEKGRLGLTEENASWAFRRNVNQPLQLLLQLKLLSKTNSGELIVTKWEKRQKASDFSSDRVRKHRAKSVTSVVTLQKQECNVLEERRGEEIRIEDTTKVAPAPKKEAFKKPEFPEMQLYAAKVGFPPAEIDKFFNHYESNGWKVGKNPMKSWQAAMCNWRDNHRQGVFTNGSAPQLNQRTLTDKLIDEI